MIYDYVAGGEWPTAGVHTRIYGPPGRDRLGGKIKKKLPDFTGASFVEFGQS